MQIIRVNCSSNYDIVIEEGIFGRLLEFENLTEDRNRICLITDENINNIYKKDLLKLKEALGERLSIYVIKPGEESKSGETYIRSLEFLAENKFTRGDSLIALGGGVVGDLTGFIAATYLRGIKYIQIPTTVLAAVDSSVGGKTAINLKAGKNLAGAFYQPDKVLIDPSFFKTLPVNIRRDGFAEIIKYGVIGSPNLFNLLKDIDNLDMENIIKSSVEIKAKLVEEDEFDKGNRMLLNLGHTFGHAIEIASDYNYSHGEAVAMGINIIARASMKKGYLSQVEYEEISDLLIKYGFDIAVDLKEKDLISIMRIDKKRLGDRINLIIPFGIGDTRIVRTGISEAEEYLKMGLE